MALLLELAVPCSQSHVLVIHGSFAYIIQLFNDPIHGSIELHPLLAEIVKMRAFTRLKNIRQLGK